MFIVVVKFDIARDHTDEFAIAVLQQARNTLELEDECRCFDVCQDGDSFLLYEKYLTSAAFDQHLQTGHFQTFDAKIQPWVVRKTVSTWSELKGTG